MIAVQNVSVRVGSFALEGISFTVPTGAHGILMGPSGTGKTTLLETVAGLHQPSCGSVMLDGRDVTRLRPALRGLGYVPQDGALFQSMTVREQLAFPLKIRNCSPLEITNAIEPLAGELGITHLLDRGVAHLSGGEIKRVAIGRALSFQPAILLLDEPLSNLDDPSRAKLRRLIQNISSGRCLTILHVTHSLEDARALGDIILTIGTDGRIHPVNPLPHSES